MGKVEARRLFREANDLWFNQGFTHRALERYQEAAQHDPTDPVLQFQRARALRAVSRDDAAQAALSMAQQHIERLSALGQAWLTEEIERPTDRPSVMSKQSVPPSELDVETLTERAIRPDQWLDVGFTARARAMYGLAAYAFGHSSESFRVQELDEDEREMEREARNAIIALHAMRQESEQESIDLLTRPVEPSAPPSLAEAPPRAHQATDPPSEPRSEAAFLVLEVRVDPWISVLEAPVTLDIALINRGTRPVAINRRLLVNNATSPPGHGELYLSAEGPPGYSNERQYLIRAGRPQDEHFGVLLPAERVAKSIFLTEFESVHLPGTYRLWATYRNTIRASVKGMPVFVGALSSEAIRLERRRP